MVLPDTAPTANLALSEVKAEIKNIASGAYIIV